MKMKSAIHIKARPGRKREPVLGDRPHRAADVLGLAPAPDRRDAALVGDDELVVFFLHATGHVGRDHAGTDFVNVDAVIGEAVGEELGHHREPGLYHAVVAAIDRRGVDGDRRDVDDATAETFGVRRLLEHLLGDKLGEEKRSLQVNLVEPVEALLAAIEQIGADFRRDAGVVHKQIDAAKFLHGLRDQALAVGRHRHIALHDETVAPGRFDKGERLGGRLGVAGVVDGDAGPGAGEFNGDPAANAARSAGNESGFRDHESASETRDIGEASQHTDC